jgi:hypothetical protein
MFLWLSLYKQTPSGRLMLWEDSSLGSGEKPVIANSSPKASHKNFSPFWEPALETKPPKRFPFP